MPDIQHPQPVLERPIGTLADAQLALIAKGIQLNSRVRLRGLFTVSTVLSMNPPPAVGDRWIVGDAGGVIDAAGNNATMYTQLALWPRLRIAGRCLIEGA